MNVFMRFPGGRAKVLTLSYDDGVIQDKRLIEILKPYGIKVTFNLNSGVLSPEDVKARGKMSLKQIKETYGDTEHEIAVHSFSHPFLVELPLPSAMQEILDDRKNLEGIFGRIVRGMAYPFGTSTNEMIEGMKSLGIVYSRGIASTKDFRLPTDWFRWTTTCHHSDPELFDLTEKFLNASPETNFAAHRSLLFYVWGHSYEFDDDNNWHVIEEFAKKVGNRDDVWYATNIEIYDYITAYNSLVFDIYGKHVYNPSCRTIWFEKNRELISVGPGETLEI